jgi:hypothetical protein
VFLWLLAHLRAGEPRPAADQREENNVFDPVPDLPAAIRNHVELDSRRRKAAP